MRDPVLESVVKEQIAYLSVIIPVGFDDVLFLGRVMRISSRMYRCFHLPDALPLCSENWETIRSSVTLPQYERFVNRRASASVRSCIDVI